MAQSQRRGRQGRAARQASAGAYLAEAGRLGTCDSICAMITALGIDLRNQKAFLVRLHGNSLTLSTHGDTGGAAVTPLGGCNRWLVMMMFVLWSHGLPILVLNDGAQYLIGMLAQVADSFSEFGLALLK